MTIALPEQNDVITLDKEKNFNYSGFHFFKNGLAPTSDNISFDQWLNCGELIRRANGSVHFWVGDWLNFGEKKWGERYTQAMEETGFDYQTLRNDKWVADRIDLSRRRDNLSFEHHKEVADLPSEQQEKLLNQAETEQINRNDFRKLKQKFVADSKRLPSGKTDNNLICGEAKVELSKLEDNSIDCVITACGQEEKLNEACQALETKVKPNSHLYFFANWANYSELSAVIETYFDIKNLIVWDKLEFSRGDLDGNFAEQHELIIFATTGRRIMNGPRQSNIMAYPKDKILDQTDDKPVGLLERLITVSTNANELVCDPFMHTGHTCIAAKNLSRRYLGIEADRKTYELAQTKIRN